MGDYVGRFQHDAYGDIVIELDGDELQFRFRHWRLPLMHFHYDRFDSRFDPIVGRWSVNFLTGPDGRLDRLETFIDGSDILFRRAAESSH
ncbi:DUF3471 domain-containing protein [Burkholderia sp. PAMC 26561]|uniref:DUF3471 domain-containing protein n=1 Tax=Burkholderia sp. PAMC 26561 TaxID=1795043 RepID=UPI003FA45528